MHRTSKENTERFVQTYGKNILKRNNVRVMELGSMDVNGSFRPLFPDNVEYVGLDIEKGPGVDVVLTNPYVFPKDLHNSFDIVISSSCFEHNDFFWMSFLEVMKVLKPNGLFYLNAPSTGYWHRYPTDSWRFYPDCGISLSKWARANGMDTILLESYITLEYFEEWNDYVGIFIKDEKYHSLYPDRIIDTYSNHINAINYKGNHQYTPLTVEANMRAWTR